MKKLMVALAAVATAFGLYADGPSYTFLSGSDFESGTLDTTYWKSSVDGAATVVEDSHGILETDIRRSAQYKNSDDAKLLKLATTLGNPVANNVLSTGLAKEITADNLCYDALVNFTVFDAGEDQIPASDFENAKLGVYLQLASDADDAATNLFVYAANGGTAQAFPCATEVTPGWHRLTIKAIKDIGGNQPGFVVFIDGAAVTSTAAQLTGADAAALNVIAAEYNRLGKLFVSTSNAAEITSVCFDGQGSVDEAYFATGSVATFTDDPATFTLTIGADIESFTATYGDQVKTWVAGSAAPEFVLGAADKLVLSNVQCANGKFLKTTEFEVDGKTITIPDAVDAVAKIGEKMFDVLADAIAEAAGTENAVVLLKTIEDDIEIVSNVTLDLNSQTIGNLTVNSGKLTVEDNGVGGKIDGAVFIDDSNGDALFNGGLIIIEGNDLDTLNNYAKSGYEFVDNGEGYYELQQEKIKVDTPTAVTGLVYDGEVQTGVEAGTGYTLTGNTATDAGSYQATATLEEGYVWDDDSTEPKKIDWSIAKVAVTVTADAQEMKAGEALPEFTYQITSGALVDGEKLTGTLTVNTDGKTEGEFDIVQANDWANDNYAVTYVGAKLTVKAAEEPVPTPISGGNTAQKNAYAEWVKGITGAEGKTDTIYADAFALNVTQAEIDEAGGDIQKATEKKLGAEITSDMVAALAAGTEVDFEALETKYPNAEFVFVEATELNPEEGVSGFWRLQAKFKALPEPEPVKD